MMNCKKPAGTFNKTIQHCEKRNEINKEKYKPKATKQIKINNNQHFTQGECENN